MMACCGLGECKQLDAKTKANLCNLDDGSHGSEFCHLIMEKNAEDGHSENSRF